MQKVIRLPELETRVGLSRTSIYERLDPHAKNYDPNFPRPFSLGSGRSVGWLESEVDSFIESLALNRREYRSGSQITPRQPRPVAQSRQPA